LADRLILGVDIGQARDPSALAVLQGHTIRWIERLPLGTTYPAVADRIAAVARAANDAPIAVDATGVGRAVVDLLRERGFGPIAVALTSGRQVRRSGTNLSIPRDALLRPLEAALEAGWLRVARGCPESESLAGELLRARRSGTSGKVVSEGPGHHGDLLVAIALALWAKPFVR
jgi:hypothetical protein